ncbi:nuclear transport factor 2 family protein [Actinocrispum sp. NPDC049592]|uniref:nuclear transport factor 2 family protein n=1 Tax=Actinocrispum sp. NPDC049592 TaxID=3154835 RepID=UPI0034304F9E
MTVVERIQRATSDHDLDALAACFTGDYQSEWPVHPARSFGGPEQVRRNWERIFAAVPDLRTEVLTSVTSGDEVWSEWEFSGTRRDGQPFLMRGVIILRVPGERATAARFYLEPVDTEAVDADVAVSRLAGS